MTSAMPLVINENKLVSNDEVSTEGKIIQSQSRDTQSSVDDTKSSNETRGIDSSELNATKPFDQETPPTPITLDYSTFLHYSNSTQTQQPISGYYVYPPPSHLIPDPESPGGNRLIGAYDVGSFFQPHSGPAFDPRNGSPSTFLRLGRPSIAPLSPSRGSSTTGATPSSPLFARSTTSSGATRGDGINAAYHGAPALPYMASPQVATNVYQMYPSSGSTDEAWVGQSVDSRYEQLYAPL
jgi:hypothetical protein